MDGKRELQRGRVALREGGWLGNLLRRSGGTVVYEGPSCESPALSLQIFLKVVEDAHAHGEGAS